MRILSNFSFSFSLSLAFKNREGNVKMRATTSVMSNFKLADSHIGAKFTRNMLDGYQLLKDSLIIGETPNVGHSVPLWVRIFFII